MHGRCSVDLNLQDHGAVRSLLLQSLHVLTHCRKDQGRSGERAMSQVGLQDDAGSHYLQKACLECRVRPTVRPPVRIGCSKVCEVLLPELDLQRDDYKRVRRGWVWGGGGVSSAPVATGVVGFGTRIFIFWNVLRRGSGGSGVLNATFTWSLVEVARTLCSSKLL